MLLMLARTVCRFKVRMVTLLSQRYWVMCKPNCAIQPLILQPSKLLSRCSVSFYGNSEAQFSWKHSTHFTVDHTKSWPAFRILVM